MIGGLRQMITKQRLTGAKKKTLEMICTYFHNNRAHMAYGAYLAAGYPIGSGVAEGACRHRVKDRLERIKKADGVKAHTGLKSEAEDIRTHVIPRTEALAMIADGRIKDAKTIIALLML